jgi:CheY-like chemotaxis protein/HPt (histidine-containing phosphotransfer) domain-containing protein
MITLSKNKRIWASIISAVILFAGTLTTVLIVTQTDFEMRPALLNNSEMIAQTLALQNVRSLSGTTDDSTTFLINAYPGPEFEHRHRSLTGWITLFSGLVITIVVAVILGLIFNIRILIVDDNTTCCEILRMYMSSWGMRVSETKHAADALLQLNKAFTDGDPFQVALIDIQIPGMDWTVISNMIKSNLLFSKTNIVLLTPPAFHDNKLNTTDCNSYLTKPVKKIELISVLNQVLGVNSVGISVNSNRMECNTPLEEKNSLSSMNYKVLLAEDNIINQQVAIGVLKKFGLKVDTVSNGIEAIKALELHHYDLVLMDIQMPEMDGYEATERIRNPDSLVINHQIPIIAMTANVLGGDRENCLEAGMNDYISKPVTPQSLIETLKRWLPDQKIIISNSDNENSAIIAAKNEKRVELCSWDKNALLKRMMGDDYLVKKVVDVFLKEISGQINKLTQLIKIDDFKGAEHQAHTIKGAAGNVGALKIQKLASEIETSAKSGNIESIVSSLPEIENSLQTITIEMQEFISSASK